MKKKKFLIVVVVFLFLAAVLLITGKLFQRVTLSDHITREPEQVKASEFLDDLKLP